MTPTAHRRPRFGFDNRYVRLPEHFYQRCQPEPVAAPQLLRFNRELARELGLDLDGCDTPTLAALFSGNTLPEDAQPLAMAYAGHQFGHFVPQLGDGRALLLGEVLDEQERRRDIQLKGSGRTAFSRQGDGRSALGPVIREYLVSEAMHALGVPSTRALAAVASGETVMREQPTPGGILTRVAASHIRVGTFQYFAVRQDQAAVRQLADHVIERHYPEVADSESPYRALLEAVSEAQARLVARWMGLGFIHGVMNTDNTALSGETLDYGPCAFMDRYRSGQVFSSIDSGGRYAYDNQPYVARWNLARLAESLLELIHEDQEEAIRQAREVLEGFIPRYEQHWLATFAAKLGLESPGEADRELIADLLSAMENNEVDFTLCFRRLCDAARGGQGAEAVADLFHSPDDWWQWQARWQQRLEDQPGGGEAAAKRMAAVNPVLIPRNHRIEQAIRAAEDEGDFREFDTLARLLAHPFSESAETVPYQQPPAPGEEVMRTFCGT
ncbi:MAG: YdiU family protein [Oleiphilaceae bacterium]|nr:YdiU family protein [Oleiphilaceae bacterium]